ncbi:MAG: hypothetical protein QXL30_05290 [Sulfolobales archaeon]
MRSTIFSVKAILLLLAIVFSQLPLQVDSSEDSVLIEVEILSSLIVVDSYFCVEENYASVEALGLPIAVLLVVPQHVYVTIEGRNISVLTTKQPECVRVRYVSEAEYSGDSLRLTYSRRVSKITIVINLSTAVPTYIRPEPADAYIVKENSIAIVWVDAEGVTFEYMLIEYPRLESISTTITQPSIETGVSQTQAPVNRTHTFTTLREVEEARSGSVRAVTVLAGLLAVLAIVLLILKLKQ